MFPSRVGRDREHGVALERPVEAHVTPRELAVAEVFPAARRLAQQLAVARRVPAYFGAVEGGGRDRNEGPEAAVRFPEGSERDGDPFEWLLRGFEAHWRRAFANEQERAPRYDHAAVG